MVIAERDYWNDERISVEEQANTAPNTAHMVLWSSRLYSDRPVRQRPADENLQ
jgi:hypothetical protein